MVETTAENNNEQRQYVDQQCLLLVVASLSKAVFSFPLTISIISFIFWPYSDHHAILLWLLSVYSISIYRFIVHRNIQRVVLTEQNYSIHLFRILFLDFLSGLTLGLGGYFLLTLPQELQWLLIIVAAAISTNSVAAQSAIKKSVFAFNIPMYVTFISWLFLANGQLNYVIICLMLVHAVFLLGHYKALHSYIIDGLTLTFINRQLANDLSLKNEALLKSNQQVKAASLAKSHFIAEISHSIREPLQGMVEGLNQSQRFNHFSDMLSSVKSVQSSGVGLLTLLNDLIDINRFENGQLVQEVKVFNVREHFDDLVSFIALNAENKGLFLYCNIHSDVADLVISDPLRLSQISLNLLANAIKFTEQGEVGLTISTQQSHGKLWLTIAVSDTGCGISEDKKDYIFQPFVHGSSVVERIGNGLGLAISQELAHLLGGSISVISTLAKGSIFSCKVPIELSSEKPLFKTFTSQKVLLIENNVNQRQAMINQLKYLNVAFELVNNAKEAMALCAGHHNKYQVVILGHQDKLQQKLLLNLCQRIKLPVIVLTALSQNSHHINKPSDNFLLTLSYPVALSALKAALNATEKTI
jgi:signal transduction histidine kinase/CheY-like chemotaxis protein